MLPLGAAFTKISECAIYQLHPPRDVGDLSACWLGLEMAGHADGEQGAELP